MLDEIFRLPHALLDIPLFGFGWVLGAWLLGGCGTLIVVGLRHGWKSAELRALLPVLTIGAIAIALLLPRLEARATAEQDVGLPLRGYGLMVTLGILAGGALATRLSRESGINPDDVYGLAFACVIGGLIGARLFYIIQYREEYFYGSWQEWLPRVLNFTEGGLVVYGSFLGAVPACYYYARKYRLPVRAIADLAAPCLMVGLSLGRIGCFLHGCCFAGLCEHDFGTVHFPHDSPPYLHQLARGQLHGVTLALNEDRSRVVVRAVDARGLAAKSGLKPGDVIRSINGQPVPPLEPRQLYVASLVLETEAGERVTIALPDVPKRSGPTLPIQLFSSVHAATLAFLLWAWYPFRRRDGEVFALLLTLYPIGRILEEIIRDDEPGRLHTSLTISQWVSLVLLAVAVVLWTLLLRRPRTVGQVAPQS